MLLGIGSSAPHRPNQDGQLEGGGWMDVWINHNRFKSESKEMSFLRRVKSINMMQILTHQKSTKLILKIHQKCKSMLKIAKNKLKSFHVGPINDFM